MGVPKTAGPAKVRFSKHADKRIRQRGLDHRHIMSVMYNLPFQDGMHYLDVEDMRLVFADEMSMRTVITAFRRNDYLG